VPESTAGLVLLADDPDAPVQGSFVHWVLYNLGPARQGVAQDEVPAEAMAGANDFGRPGYLGPAPPPGDDPHHYVFRLLAVDEPVRLTQLSSYQDVEAAVTGHVLGEARSSGRISGNVTAGPSQPHRIPSPPDAPPNAAHTTQPQAAGTVRRAAECPAWVHSQAYTAGNGPTPSGRSARGHQRRPSRCRPPGRPTGELNM
jgi:hypothetical protein